MTKFNKFVNESANIEEFKTKLSEYFTKDLSSKGTIDKENLKSNIESWIQNGFDFAQTLNKRQEN